MRLHRLFFLAPSNNCAGDEGAGAYYSATRLSNRQVSVRPFAVRPFAVRKEREIPRMVLASATFVPQYVLSRPVIFRFPLKTYKNCNLRMKDAPSGTPFLIKIWTQKRV